MPVETGRALLLLPLVQMELECKQVQHFQMRRSNAPQSITVKVTKVMRYRDSYVCTNAGAVRSLTLFMLGIVLNTGKL